MIVTTLLLALISNGAPEKFEVKSLPGWDGPLLTKTYCGFTNAGTPPSGSGTQYFNYIFLESENDPVNDPVVVWYNGGPGAASMFGLFVELGPYYLNQDSLDDPKYNETGIPQVKRNLYSWTKVANVIAVNNPPPIGFSYCEGGKSPGPSGDGYSCGDWDDAKVAVANHRFLTNFFTTDFPEFAKNDLFLVGESYAGVYIPTIVREILKAPGPMNLVGFAVGDGCMGTDVLCGATNEAVTKGPYYRVEFMHGHGQVSERNYRSIMKECTEASLKTGENMSPACIASLAQMEASLGGFFDYSLYDDCIYDESFGRRRGGLNDYACPSNAMSEWLNRKDVRAALNIQPENRFNSADNGVGMNYTLSEKNVLPIYENARTNTSLRVLVYNGDTDPGINSMVTQDMYFNYFDSIGVEELEKWRPWTLDGKQRMGGYVVKYPGDWNYLTIRGSGHMVPEYKPAATLAFLKAFLKGSAYPPYNKPKHGRKKLWTEL